MKKFKIWERYKYFDIWKFECLRIKNYGTDICNGREKFNELPSSPIDQFINCLIFYNFDVMRNP